MSECALATTEELIAEDQAGAGEGGEAAAGGQGGRGWASPPRPPPCSPHAAGRPGEPPSSPPPPLLPPPPTGVGSGAVLAYPSPPPSRFSVGPASGSPWSTPSPPSPPHPAPPAWDHRWDERALAGRRPTGATRHIYLVRHGQYEPPAGPGCGVGFGVDPAATGSLTPLGCAQARFCGAHLAARLTALGCAPPARVTYSPLARAEQTAHALTAAAGWGAAGSGGGHGGAQPQPPPALLRCDPRLAEGAPCVPSPDWWHPSADDVARDGARMEAAFGELFHRDAEPAGVGGGATGPPAEAGGSGGGGWAAAAGAGAPNVTGPAASVPSHPGGGGGGGGVVADVIVAHGNVLRYFVCRALQIHPSAWLRLVLPHASITTLTGARQRGGRGWRGRA